jgi:hypothetical protein
MKALILEIAPKELSGARIVAPVVDACLRSTKFRI